VKNASSCPTGSKGTMNNNHVDSHGLDLKHQQEFGWLASRLVAGVYLDYTDNGYVSDNLSVTQDAVSLKNLRYVNSNAIDPKGVRDYQTDIRNDAFFAQWEFTPVDKLRAVVGARSDAIRYGYTNRLAPQGSANFGAPNGTRSFSHLSPKVGATYALTREANLYTNLSEGFTPPEVSQLYGKTGIPDLKPATYDNIEIGLRMAFLEGALKLDSALYRLDGRDTIVSYTVQQGVSENRNAGRTRSQGLELGLNYDGALFDARFATAIASHRYRAYRVSGALDYSGREMPQAPRDISSAEIGYKPVAGARVAVEVLHQGRYWMDNANSVAYGGHTLFNLRANYQFAKQWELWLQARNVTGKHYADNASSSYSGVGAYVPNTQNQYTPGAPRSLMLGLAYTYGAQ
jgi:outer membrane receptor protein involved in Fe transport